MARWPDWKKFLIRMQVMAATVSAVVWFTPNVGYAMLGTVLTILIESAAFDLVIPYKRRENE